MSDGVYQGSETDRTDGFIHFSDSSQIRKSVAKFHGGKTDLVSLTVDADRLGDNLKWETSRNNKLYPHLYANLDVAQVLRVDPLLLGEDGEHIFPTEFID